MKTRIITGIICCSLILLGLVARGQLFLPKFDHISLEDGLSQANVYTVVQDQIGYLWMGTEDGLHRYDGYSFSYFKNDPSDTNSLSYNDVRAILVDKKGLIWIGTYGGGLNSYNPVTGVFTQYSLNKDPNSRDFGKVLSLEEGPSGEIWIGTQSKGLWKLDPQHAKPYQLAEWEALRGINCMGILDQNLFVGTEENGLVSLALNDTPYTFQIQVGQVPEGTAIRALVFSDTKPGIWLATSKGLFLIDENGKTIQYQPIKSESFEPGNDFRSILEDRYGMFWLGSQEQGLFVFEPKSARFKPIRHQVDVAYSLGKDRLLSLFEDRSGVVWIGTFGGGVDRFDRASQTFLHFPHKPKDPNSMSHPMVRGITQTSDGAIWVATAGGGISRLNRSTEQYKTISKGNLPSDMCMHVMADTKGHVWVATDQGVVQLNNKGEKLRLFEAGTQADGLLHPFARYLFEDREGDIWIGTFGGGLSCWNPKQETFRHYQYDPASEETLSSNDIRAVFQSKDGYLWIATYGGLNRLNKETGHIQRYVHQTDNPNSLSTNWVQCVYEDGQGILWIGTNAGLNRFEPQNGRFTRYTEKDGLPNNLVYGILPDNQGKLWLSTNRGISCFDPRGPIGNQFQNFGLSYGIQSYEFNGQAYFRNAQGELFFGGINGLNLVNPQRLHVSEIPPGLVLTEIQVGSKSIDTINLLSHALHLGGQEVSSGSQGIVLPYQENNISLNFAALHFEQPSLNTYSFRLKGQDHHWTQLNRDFVSFTNLSPGEYEFELKAANPDGVWTKNAVVFPIKVNPPWWQSWLAYVCYLALFIGVIYLVYRMEERKLQRKQAELDIQQRLNEQLKEADRMRAQLNHDLMRLNEAYVRFVPHEFVSALGRDSVLDLKLGDQVEKKVAVLFSDIRSYTNLAETMTPEENFNFLNAYLGRIGPIIKEFGGFVNQYYGDGIMAIFQENSEQAVKAAIGIHKKLDEYNLERAVKERKPIKVGVGIHFGPLRMGIIGDKERMEAGVVADTVNTAARMEGLTKLYGSSILVSEDVLESVENLDSYKDRFLGKVRVKGKKNAIGIYEIIDGDPPEIIQAKIQSFGNYQEGVKAYFSRDFPEASKQFQKVLDINPRDKTAKHHLLNAMKYMVQGVSQRWDGIEDIRTK
ncbi:MAG: two-component regulator propeller domain-containing protein [Bacteroidota bacterium]